MATLQHSALMAARSTLEKSRVVTVLAENSRSVLTAALLSLGVAGALAAGPAAVDTQAGAEKTAQLVNDIATMGDQQTVNDALAGTMFRALGLDPKANAVLDHFAAELNQEFAQEQRPIAVVSPSDLNQVQADGPLSALMADAAAVAARRAGLTPNMAETLSRLPGALKDSVGIGGVYDGAAAAAVAADNSVHCVVVSPVAVNYRFDRTLGLMSGGMPVGARLLDQRFNDAGLRHNAGHQALHCLDFTSTNIRNPITRAVFTQGESNNYADVGGLLLAYRSLRGEPAQQESLLEAAQATADARILGTVNAAFKVANQRQGTTPDDIDARYTTPALDATLAWLKLPEAKALVEEGSLAQINTLTRALVDLAGPGGLLNLDRLETKQGGFEAVRDTLHTQLVAAASDAFEKGELFVREENGKSALEEAGMSKAFAERARLAYVRLGDNRTNPVSLQDPGYAFGLDMKGVHDRMLAPKAVAAEWGQKLDDKKIADNRPALLELLHEAALDKNVPAPDRRALMAARAVEAKGEISVKGLGLTADLLGKVAAQTKNPALATKAKTHAEFYATRASEAAQRAAQRQTDGGQIRLAQR